MPQVRALKPFIPSGPDFDAAKAFFVDFGFTIAWTGRSKLPAGSRPSITWTEKAMPIRNASMSRRNRS